MEIKMIGGNKWPREEGLFNCLRFVCEQVLIRKPENESITEMRVRCAYAFSLSTKGIEKLLACERNCQLKLSIKRTNSFKCMDDCSLSTFYLSQVVTLPQSFIILLLFLENQKTDIAFQHKDMQSKRTQKITVLDILITDIFFAVFLRPKKFVLLTT